jgi:hypothetical protein
LSDGLRVADASRMAAADQAALQEYAATREQVRRARAAARQNSFFPVVFVRPAAG